MSNQHISVGDIESSKGVAIGDGASVVINEAMSAAPPAPGAPPFKGLHRFDIEDAPLFFGREKLTSELVDHLHETNFLAVVGASGSGKSSLVRAGLVAALQQKKPLTDGVLPPVGSSQWTYLLMTPTSRPLHALAVQLMQLDTLYIESHELVQQLRTDPSTLRRCLEQSQNVGGGMTPPAKTVLVVDQFEELFTQLKPAGGDADQQRREIQAAFVDNLIYAITPANEAGPLTLILTLRADFYSDCAQFENLRTCLSTRQKYIGPMNVEEMRSAIEQPLLQNNWIMQPELVEQILHDVGQEPGALPLLSHALLETWKRRSGRMLTHAGYRSAGGIRGAIAHTAERLYEQLDQSARPTMRRIFLQLTEIGEGAQDTRRRAPYAALFDQIESKETVANVIQKLTEGRLVTTDDEDATLEPENQDVVVEVAHEALIREWPRLRLWLDESRDWLRVQRRITAAALEWQRLDQDASLLYRGNRLAQATEWMAEQQDTIDPLTHEFLLASLAEKQKEEQRAAAIRQREDRLKRIAMRRLQFALGIVTILLLVLAGWFARLRYFRYQAAALGPLKPIERLNMAMEQFEVTNQRYQYCVSAGRCVAPPSRLNAFFADPDDARGAQRPVTGINALNAATFCGWIGRQLPTYAEWLDVATQSGQSQWPWGNAEIGEVNVESANFNYDGGENEALPVGLTERQSGANPEGIYDLAGNVAEWTATEMLNWGMPPEVNQTPWDLDPIHAPEQLTVMGYSFMRGPIEPNVANSLDSTIARADIGFRCIVRH